MLCTWSLPRPRTARRPSLRRWQAYCGRRCARETPLRRRAILCQAGDEQWFRGATGGLPASALCRSPQGTRAHPEGTRLPVAPDAAQAKQVPPAAMGLPERPPQPLRGLDHRSPSGLEGGRRVALARQLRLDRGDALERGSLMHAWFQQIAWLEDGEPDDARLRQVAQEQGLAHLDLPQLLAEFRAALRRPAICGALQRATYERPASKGAACQVHAPAGIANPRWELWRERAFAVRQEDGILSGKFDRVVVLYDGHRVVGAEVLDYKTDAVGADDPRAIDARAELYGPQMEAYRWAAARLLGLELGRVSARLLFVGPGVIRA